VGVRVEVLDAGLEADHLLGQSVVQVSLSQAGRVEPLHVPGHFLQETRVLLPGDARTRMKMSLCGSVLNHMSF